MGFRFCEVIKVSECVAVYLSICWQRRLEKFQVLDDFLNGLAYHT